MWALGACDGIFLSVCEKGVHRRWVDGWYVLLLRIYRRSRDGGEDGGQIKKKGGGEVRGGMMLLYEHPELSYLFGLAPGLA